MPSRSFSFGNAFRKVPPLSSEHGQQASSSSLVSSSTRSNVPYRSFSSRNIFRMTLPATSTQRRQTSSTALASPLSIQSSKSSMLFSFRKIVRRILPASSRNPQQAPENPNPVTGGRGDVAMNTIQTSLAALKDGSTLVASVPYISPIAGLLLQTLTMRDEVKQCRVEWGILMEKVASVSSIVVDVGELCRIHDLREELPTGLRAILETLRSDLHEIESTLRECKKIRGIRRVLLRTDMLRKIKQYDSKLSHILQTVQTKLALDSRFASIGQNRKMTTMLGQHASRIEVITSMTRKANVPQITLGQDDQVAKTRLRRPVWLIFFQSIVSQLGPPISSTMRRWRDQERPI